MVPELEKPRVTEIKVRMDCNGCVQKIKKALHGINGIYDLYIDFPEQKLTIIGWADPEKVVKAIKKARKTASITSHSEVPDPPPAQPTEQPPPDQPAEQPPPDQQTAQPPEAAGSQEAVAASPAEPPKEPPVPENPPSDTKPSNATNDNSVSAQPFQPSGPKDVEEVHVIYYNPSTDHGYRYGYSQNYSHGYGGQWNNHPNYPRFHQEPGLQQVTPQPVTYNYNTYKPSPSVTHTYNTNRPSSPYTAYNNIRSPPHSSYYYKPEQYDDNYNNNNSTGNGTITSVFSDENPNACTIA